MVSQQIASQVFVCTCYGALPYFILWGVPDRKRLRGCYLACCKSVLAEQLLVGHPYPIFPWKHA